MYKSRQLWLHDPTSPRQIWGLELMKSAKMSYYASLINDNKYDFRVLFKSIDHLLHRKPEKHYPTCGSTKELCNKYASVLLFVW